MNLNDLKETGLNISGVEFALDEILMGMGLFVKNINRIPFEDSESEYDLIEFEIYTMEKNTYIGEISIPDSADYPYAYYP